MITQARAKIRKQEWWCEFKSCYQGHLLYYVLLHNNYQLKLAKRLKSTFQPLNPQCLLNTACLPLGNTLDMDFLIYLSQCIVRELSLIFTEGDI